MEQSFIAQKLDIHLLLPEIHNTFNIFIRAKYHQVPLKYIHWYRLKLVTNVTGSLLRAGEVAFTPVFQANFLTVPGTILYNQANYRIFGNHRRGSAEFFQFQQARPVEAQTDRLLLPGCLKRNAADEESQSLDYKNLLPAAALDSEYRASPASAPSRQKHVPFFHSAHSGIQH